MIDNISRRDFLKVTAGALALGTGSEEATAENIPQAVEDTVNSLTYGIRRMHGRNVDPRNSGFAYHPKLLKHYRKGLNMPAGLSAEAIVTRVQQYLRERIKIFPITQRELGMFQKEDCVADLQRLDARARDNEVVGVVYISDNRRFQRLYAARKTSANTFQFLESYPMSTSKGAPEVPSVRPKHQSVKQEPVTPLGVFKVPFDGVRLALPGEVTKIERPDITRYYFEAVDVDGVERPFVKNFNSTAPDEIVTVTGDTHLLWSPEIADRGVKLHDTTELNAIGTPASSGCIRTPSVRRFTLLTKDNRHPTEILVHWENHRGDEQGFGGMFGGERIQ